MTFAKNTNAKTNIARPDSWISMSARQHYREFTPEEVARFLKNPRGYEKELRDLARLLRKHKSYLSRSCQLFIKYSCGCSCINP